MNQIDVYYRSRDGLRLYARDYRGPTADAPVVLCLPGLTRNSKDFARLAAQLCRSHRVICPDQRGRGRSARDPEPGNYRPDVYVGDMWCLADLLGLERFSIVGTSLGGIMAIMMAVGSPDRVDRLVLNDVGPEIDPRGIARIAGYVGKSGPVANWQQAAEQTAAVNGVAFPDFGADDWMAMACDIYVQEGTTPVLDYDPQIARGLAGGSATPDLWPFFKALGNKPVLALRGASSDILAADTLAKMAQSLPQLKPVEVPNRGHAPSLDEPAALAALRDFLAA